MQDIQLTDKAPIYGTGRYGNFAVSDLSGTTTVLTGQTGVFPDRVISSDARIYTRRVIGPGGTGAMDMTVVDSTGWYRLRGAAQIIGDSLQGFNLVVNGYFGPNLVTVYTDIHYQQLPVFIPEAIVGGQTKG